MNVNHDNGPVAEAERIIAQANRINRSAKRVGVFLLIAAALLVGFNWPQPADAAVTPTASIGGRVDICAIEVPKSWTKKLQRKANRAFSQRVKVVRTNEWKLADQPCDIFVSTSEDRRTVILSDASAAEWEVTATAGRKSQRPAAIVATLRSLGIR